MSITDTDRLSGWSPELVREFEVAKINGRVGTRLLSQSDRVRVWEIRLLPGERIGFHRHVLDYFWVAVTSGRSRSHLSDGRIVESSYQQGDTKHFQYALGEDKIHDLENISSEEIVFTTVEFLDSANSPLPID